MATGPTSSCPVYATCPSTGDHKTKHLNIVTKFRLVGRRQAQLRFAQGSSFVRHQRAKQHPMAKQFEKLPM